jgi:hypothetical protein
MRARLAGVFAFAAPEKPDDLGREHKVIVKKHEPTTSR